MRRLLKYYLLIIAFGIKGLWAQDGVTLNQSRLIQRTNPSYFGFNNINRAGVVYNTLTTNINDKADNKYVYGMWSFDDQKFSLGFDINSMKLQNTGVSLTNARLGFVYKLQLDYNLFFLPSVTLGYTSTSFNLPSLVFEDQINAITGYITTQSNDPLSKQLAPIQFPHFSASLLLHNDIFLAGLTLDYLNQPNASLEKTSQEKLPIRIGLQGGVEMDINPYQNSFLPNNSYFFLFTSLKKTTGRTDLFFSQDFQLDNFSLGVSQQASLVNGFSFNNLGISMGLSVEHFDFGFQYALPMRKIGVAHPPKVFELYVSFDFTPFRRNNRGFYKRLQTDNYY